MNKKCYLIVEICWDEAGRESPCEVWLDKKLAQAEVDRRNSKVEFTASGEAIFNEEFNCAISWKLRELTLKDSNEK